MWVCRRWNVARRRVSMAALSDRVEAGAGGEGLEQGRGIELAGGLGVDKGCLKIGVELAGGDALGFEEGVKLGLLRLGIGVGGGGEVIALEHAGNGLLDDLVGLAAGVGGILQGADDGILDL